MKKILACCLFLIFILSVCAGAFAKTIIIKSPPKTKVIKTVPKKTVMVKRYYYPKTTVVIVGKPFVVRPWKWRARVRVIVAGAPVRVYPHPSAAIIVTVLRDSEYDAIKRQNKWALIKFDGKEGWVNMDQLEVKKLESLKSDGGEGLEEESVPVEPGNE